MVTTGGGVTKGSGVELPPPGAVHATTAQGFGTEGVTTEGGVVVPGTPVGDITGVVEPVGSATGLPVHPGEGVDAGAGVAG